MKKSVKVERDPEKGVNWRKETTETEDKKVIVEKEVGWFQDKIISREEIKKK
jgi:hypothetical protein